MTQASVTDVQRATFEKWADGAGLNLHRHIYEGVYTSPRTAWCYRTWQAALSTKPKVVSADISADRNWIAGAQWGFARGLENDNASLAEAIEARQRDIKAAKAIIGEGN